MEIVFASKGEAFQLRATEYMTVVVSSIAWITQYQNAQIENTRSSHYIISHKSLNENRPHMFSIWAHGTDTGRIAARHDC